MTEGPPKKEGLLVGLKNGEIYRIFIDNPFPIHLINHDVTISHLDLSANRRKLAVVDNKNNFYMYDIVTKEQLASELKVTSVAFNSEFEDMVAYAGEGLLFIKGGDFPAITLKQNGNLVGFRGAKCRMVYNGTILMVDIPLSSHLFNYIQRKNFKAAYNIASLGVPDHDLKYLGTEALANQEFDIAKRCFTRIKDVGYLDLAIKYERDVKNNTFEEISLKADLLAFDHKVKPASELLQKSGKLDRAIELCIKMRRWNEALAIVKNAQRAGTLNNSDNKYNL
jgi:intraflagellar transport protein 122